MSTAPARPSTSPAGPQPGHLGVSARTWRAAAVLFLTVLVGGMGLTSAAALWSQQGQVAATVTTGSWVQSGWTWTPVGLAAQATSSGGYVDLAFRWQPPAGMANATYTLTVDDSAITQGTVKDSRPGTEPATWRMSLHQHLAGKPIPLRLTATVDGQTSAPVYLEVVFTRDGQATIRQVTRP